MLYSLFTHIRQVVYVARDPRDAAVSYYHFSKALKTHADYDSWDHFFQDFCDGYGNFTWWGVHENLMMSFTFLFVIRMNTIVYSAYLQMVTPI